MLDKIKNRTTITSALKVASAKTAELLKMYICYRGETINKPTVSWKISVEVTLLLTAVRVFHTGRVSTFRK